MVEISRDQILAGIEKIMPTINEGFKKTEVPNYRANDVMKVMGLKEYWDEIPYLDPEEKKLMEQISKEFFNIGIVAWGTRIRDKKRSFISFRKLKGKPGWRGDDINELLEEFPMSSWVREQVLDKEMIEELGQIENLLGEAEYIVNTSLTPRHERKEGHDEIGITISGWKFVDMKK